MRITRIEARAIGFVACLCVTAMAAAQSSKTQRDEFFWLGEFNKAAAVMTVEEKIVPKPLGARIAEGVIGVALDGDKPGGKRPSDYLQYETLLIAKVGQDATQVHSGRSRQDLIPTTRRVMVRDRVLALSDALVKAREKILATAAEHKNTIMPTYTNGVQAQPTYYGHYLLGYASALDRADEARSVPDCVGARR